MSRSPCCPENSQPFLAENPFYIPIGENIGFDDISAYIVGKGPTCIIFIHDIFGLNSGMNRLVCDNLSAKLPNVTIIAPNFYPLGNLMGSDPLTERGEGTLKWKIIWSFLTCQLLGFIQRYSWENSTEHIFNSVTKHMIATYKCEKFITMGICWGSYVGFKAGNDALHKDLIVGNISLHPSVDTLASHYKYKQMDLVNGVQCPQFIASTKDEKVEWKPNGIVQQALSQRNFADKCEYYVYPNEAHGFFTRGDTKLKHTREAINEVMENITAFVKNISV